MSSMRKEDWWARAVGGIPETPAEADDGDSGDGGDIILEAGGYCRVPDAAFAWTGVKGEKTPATPKAEWGWWLCGI